MAVAGIVLGWIGAGFFVLAFAIRFFGASSNSGA
jgi:hypothetical protein